MHKNKKLTALLALFLALVMMLSACNGQKTPANDDENTPPPQDTTPDDGQGDDTPAAPVDDVDEMGSGTNLINFASPNADLLEIDAENKTVTLGNSGGDNGAGYMGLEKASLSFVFEFDVELIEGNGQLESAAITFGYKDPNYPTVSWYGANVDTGRKSTPQLFRVFGPGMNETTEGGEIGDIDLEKPLHMKLDIDEKGNYTYSFGNAGGDLRSMSGTIPNWFGGYMGLLTFNTKAKFYNITLENRAWAESTEIDMSYAEEGDDHETVTNLTDFTSINDPNGLKIDEAAGTVTLGDLGGDHFAVYNGLDHPTNSFILEADVNIIGGGDPNALSAALIFGLESKETPNWKWYGANFDTSRVGSPNMFRVFGGGFESGLGGEQGDIDFTKPLHLKIEMRRNGDMMYTFGNVGDAEMRHFTEHIPNWEGGYVGILSFKSEIEFSNISFKDRSTAAGSDDSTVTTVDGYADSLGSMKAYGGDWQVSGDTLTANSVGKGNTFAYSQTNGTDFVYSTDVTISGDTGLAALVFRSQSTESNANAYALSVNKETGVARLTRWESGRTLQLVDDRPVGTEGTYSLKVIALDNWIAAYVNDVLIASTGDYVLQPGNRGQNTIPEGGTFGLQSTNGEVTFSNTTVTEITDANTPIVSNITVTSAGTVEPNVPFTSTWPCLIQFVGNDAETVDINVTTANSATVTVTDAAGNTYEGGKGIPVAKGPNIITVTSTTEVGEGVTATLTYRVNVYRRQEASVYYNETYRDQYHFSVKDGWGNDPNGLVYYNGTWHMFYQYCTYTHQEAMHWGHSISTDLIHWEELPVAFYPDSNGVEFSGCMVADTNNTSGLFSTEKGGLVAIITADGNGQRLKLAYSEDEGRTWTKLDKVIADWSNDPLKVTDFRDPKVFRWENKWFMVLAGGPLRVYSSDNLIDWTCESTYGIYTECPDLYPIQLEDGAIKWVLSRGGRLYKVGDFGEVDGKWTFTPDEAYQNADGIMNFGMDSYAAMTFYTQDFGTAANPTIPTITEVNWMNTWAYCNEVGNALGQDFNGTYNLFLDLGLTKDENGTYLLTQTPSKIYESLRGEAAVDVKDVEVNSDILNGFTGDCYEIIATFRPNEKTQRLGFRVRTGNGQETVVGYDAKSGAVMIDRSNSGVMVSGNFKDGGSQAVTLNPDGSIDMHIFVDRASVEIFAKGYTVAGADQIFPDASSTGLEIFAAGGGTVTADVTIYPLNSIWH